MKKLAAIFFLGILLFNGWGYRLLTSWMEDRANVRLEAQLDDNEYDQSQLLSVKVPVTRLAYSISSLQYERVSGEIDINGIHYKYCKRRIFNDSLELLCIPNPTAMKMQAASTDFFKLVNDLPQNGPGKNPASRPGASRHFPGNDYLPNDALVLLHPAAVASKNPHPDAVQFTSRFIPASDRPPQFSDRPAQLKA